MAITKLFGKPRTLLAPLVALSMVLCTSARADLDDDTFVTLTVMSAYVAVDCPGYTNVEGGLMKWADKHGVDEAYLPAILHAMAANTGFDDYDRDKLIPKVTKYTRFVMKIFDRQKKEMGLQRFCKKYGRTVVNNGTTTVSDGDKR